MTREGHAVSQHAVAFYAPDSEQAGMLARAQEIENLDRQQRAQALIARTKRAAPRCAWRRTTPTPRSACWPRAAKPPRHRTRAHGLHVELLRLTQQADAASSRRDQLGDELAEIDAQLEALEERRATAEGRFEELDIQLAHDAGTPRRARRRRDRRRAHAWRDAREQQRALERQAQEARFQARALAARRDELQRSIETAAAQVAANVQAGEQLQLELGSFDDAAAQCRACRPRWRCKLEREQRAGRWRAATTTTSARSCGAPTSSAWRFERSLDPLREQITQAAAGTAGGAAGRRAVPGTADARPQVDFEALAAGHRSRRRQALGPADRDRPHPEGHQRPGRGQPGGAGRTDGVARAQDLPRRAVRRPAGGHGDAGRRDPEDRPGDARPAGQHLQPGQRTFRPHVPQPVRRRQRAAGDDRHRDPGLRRAGDGAAAGQEEQHHPPAVAAARRR